MLKTESGRSGVQTEVTIGIEKKRAKNGVAKKMMQRGDHHDGLVVLIPMVETVRKMGSVWVQKSQNKKRSTDYK